MIWAKPKATMLWWEFVTYGKEEYLCGEIKEHPTLPRGSQVRTSKIIKKEYNKKIGIYFVETLNTVYHLGE